MRTSNRPQPVPCQYPGCTVKRANYGTKEARMCARHGQATVVKLTGPQAEWVDWALTGPIDEWGYPEDLAWSHDITEEEARMAILARDATELRRVAAGKGWSADELLLPSWVTLDNAFIGDLLNMLEDVAPDVAGGYGFDEAHVKHGYNAAHAITAKRAECARNAAGKIREAIG